MGRGKRKSFDCCVDDAKIQTAGNKKVKKIQNDTICKNAGGECPRYKIITACTDTFDGNYLTHPEGRINGKRNKSPNLVSMKGDSNNQKKLYVKCSKRNPRDAEPELKHYKHTGDIDDIKTQKHSVKIHQNANTLSEDKKSRINQNPKKNKTLPLDNCSCLGKVIYSATKAQTEGENNKSDKKSKKSSKKESIKDNDPENPKTDINVELKSKKQEDAAIVSNEKGGKKKKKAKKADNSKQKKKTCLCPTEESELSEKKKVEFTCCTDTVQSKSNIGIDNIKNKLSCLCRRYSQKILPQSASTPVNQMIPTSNVGDCEGLCKKAVKNKSEDSPCKSSKRPKKSECTNETCDARCKRPNRISLNSTLSQTKTKQRDSFVSPGSCEPECQKICFKDMIKNKLMSRRSTNISEHINKIPRHAGDQTGEPFIEIKVDEIGMCVLNPDEIKNRVIDLSKKYPTKPSCRCRSHKKRREEFLDKNLCEEGLCHKTFKDKKTNFKCKCDRGGECTDLTCGGNNIYCGEQGGGCGCNPTPIITSNNPMFEVKLDSKRMCVMNSEEIHQKIMDIEREAKERADADCPGGICGIAHAGFRDRFKCKCIEKKRKPEEISECSNETCDEYGAQYPASTNADLVCYWLSKLYKLGKNINKSKQTKVTRKPVNTMNDTRNIKSILSSVGDEIKSTPDIWTGSTYRKPKRHRRRNVSFNSPNPYGMPRNANAMPRTAYGTPGTQYGMRGNPYGMRGPPPYCTNRREGVTINVNRNHSETCTCAVCMSAKAVPQSLLCKCKSFLSFSFLRNRHKYTVNGTNGNFHKRNGLSLPPQRPCQTQYSYRPTNISQGTDLSEESPDQEATTEKKKKDNNLCACDTTCECADAMEKQKEKEMIRNIRKKKPVDNRKNKIKKLQEQEKNKEFQSADKEYQKRLDKKRKEELKKRIKVFKQEQKEMRELSKQDEARDTNCLVDFIIGLLRLIFIAARGTLSVMFKIATDPEGSYRYCRQRLRDPKDTLDKLQRWIGDAWQHQKFRMNKAIKGSRTMTILTDEVKDSEAYQAFAPKGKTDDERRFIEAGNRRRKKRILKRHNEALYGCRHMLLVTLRKQHCMWVYHICPNIYPQFLSARMFCINFAQMLTFCLAVAFWTPCIACCEACRGLMCCMLCTQ